MAKHSEFNTMAKNIDFLANGTLRAWKPIGKTESGTDRFRLKISMFILCIKMPVKYSVAKSFLGAWVLTTKTRFCCPSIRQKANNHGR